MSIDVSGFSAVGSAAKIRLICRLAETCSLEELKAIHEEISKLLQRDFLFLLPLELVESILSFLDLATILSCLRVSRQWNRIVTACNPIWKKYCKLYGLNGRALIEQAQRFPTLKHLAVATKRLSRIEKKPVIVLNKDMGWVVYSMSALASPLAKLELFAILEKQDHIALSDFVVESRVLKEVSSLPITTQQCMVTWCALTVSGLIVYTSDGQWVLMAKADSDWSITGTWHGDIYSAAYFRFAVCPECGLVMVADIRPADSQWSIQLIKLSSRGVEKEYATLHSSHASVLCCFIRKVALLPGLGGPACCCETHKVVVQIAKGIALYTLAVTDELSGYQLTGPIWSTSVDECKSIDYSEEFCLSSDATLVAICDKLNLYVWELDTGIVFAQWKTVESSVCYAVGRLFAFIGSASLHHTLIMHLANGEYLRRSMSNYYTRAVSLLCTKEWLDDIPASSEEASIVIVECEMPRNKSPLIAMSVHKSELFFTPYTYHPY